MERNFVNVAASKISFVICLVVFVMDVDVDVDGYGFMMMVVDDC